MWHGGLHSGGGLLRAALCPAAAGAAETSAAVAGPSCGGPTGGAYRGGTGVIPVAVVMHGMVTLVFKDLQSILCLRAFLDETKKNMDLFLEGIQNKPFLPVIGLNNQLGFYCTYCKKCTCLALCVVQAARCSKAK